VVSDPESGRILKDFTESAESFVAAKGGRGGRGNKHFASSTNRTPRFAQPGESGQTLSLKLELKLLADVGIIGLPNAGKSTLISAISSAHPKIGDYPFTSLTPTLGVVQTGHEEPFTVADIPGLIEGAHKGAGLGARFLKHVERTRILIHLIDAGSIDASAPLQGYQTINRELSFYSQELAQKPQIVVLNKLDLPGAKGKADIFEKAAGGVRVQLISAMTGEGLKGLEESILRMLDQTHG
jgi:GTP-binding protein